MRVGIGVKKAGFTLALVFVALCAMPFSATAQYYDWGQNPATVKWMQIKTQNGKYVFPKAYKAKGVRLMNYMEGVNAHVGYGFTRPPMKMPLVMHTQNFQSNGIVMLAPNRMEYIVTPPAATAAMPWLKQLAVHEYRHAVQYANLNQGVIKALGYLLGQQGTALGMAFLSVWAMEGDAVMAETQMSKFGRGLQPSFTIDYRAFALEGADKRYRVDKYFSGSYKDHIPDHYQLGYQITSYAYTKYGENVWDKTTRFGARNPYFFFTESIALKKYYATSSGKLFKETFDDLYAYWRAMPLVDNTTSVVETPTSSYTTYSSPIALNDSTAVAFKSDLDRPSRLVEIDLNSGVERTLLQTGVVNTAMTLSNGVLLWSEYRPSTFWEQRINAVPCYYDLKSGKSGRLKGERRAQFVVAMERGGAAIAEYNYGGNYAISHDGWRVEIPDTVSLHGLAYDLPTESFYFIALSDEGMWIGSAKHGESGFEAVTKPSYSTLANLRAHEGTLYYNSIASGKDEAHCYEIASGREYQITESRYGSFEPSPMGGGERAVVVTYTPKGYMVATQDMESKQEIEHSVMPRNVLNPPRIKWNVPNIDTMTMGDTTSREIKKYRKATKLFRFHSWMPIYFDPDKLLNESSLDVNIGATIFSQNLLNSTFATLGYQYTDEGSLFKAGVKYYGWAPKIEVEAEYGTMKQLVYSPFSLSAQGYRLRLNNHFKATARVFLPIRLGGGYHSRVLMPIVELEHLNAKLVYSAKDEPLHMRNGLQKLKSSLQFTDNVRLAHRDFLPRWGYALRVTNTMSPFNNKVGKIWSGYARTYLPGFAAHHSLMLRGAAQYHNLSTYNYSQKELFPRGARFGFVPERYASMAIDYQLPIWYPEGGWSSLVYFRRIRANLAYDYARYRVRGDGAWRDLYSYGIDLLFDLTVVRMPSSANSTVTITIHKPSDKSGVVVGASLSLPL